MLTIIQFLTKPLRSWKKSYIILSANYYYHKSSPYRSKYEYYFTHNVIYKLENFEKVLSEIQNSETRQLKTLAKVTPLDLNFLISESEAIKLKGKPKFILSNHQNITSHRILFFKEKLGKYTLLTQLHFIENKLLLVKQDISYSHLNNSQLIFELLKQKYLLNPLGDVNFDRSCFQISDTFGGNLLVKHGFKTELIYVAHAPELFNNIGSLINEIKEVSARYKQLIEDKLLQCL